MIFALRRSSKNLGDEGPAYVLSEDPEENLVLADKIADRLRIKFSTPDGSLCQPVSEYKDPDFGFVDEEGHASIGVLGRMKRTWIRTYVLSVVEVTDASFYC